MDLQEHSIVFLIMDIGDIPKGSSGTIIDIHEGGYTIEFFEPKHCIIDVEREYIDYFFQL